MRARAEHFFESARQFFAGQDGLGLRPIVWPLAWKNGVSFLNPEGAAQEDVVSDDGMQIQRQMRAVDGEVAVERGLNLAAGRAGEGLHAAPKEAVMDERADLTPCPTAFSIVVAHASTAAPIL